MTKPLPSGRIQRGLIGGIISALLGGGCFSLYLYEAGSGLDGILMFVCLGFGLPALIDPTRSEFTHILRVTIFWFGIGGATGYLARNNKAAIGTWLLVYAISSGVSIALFANIMN